MVYSARPIYYKTCKRIIRQDSDEMIGTGEKKLVTLWLDNELIERIDRHKREKRFPTRKYLIDSVLRTYMNHVEIEEGIV